MSSGLRDPTVDYSHEISFTKLFSKDFNMKTTTFYTKTYVTFSFYRSTNRKFVCAQN